MSPMSQCLNVLTLQHEPWHWLLVLRWTRWQMEDKLAPQNLTRRRKVQKNIWNWLKGKEFERNWPLISTSLLSLIKAMSFWYLAMQEIYFSTFAHIGKLFKNTKSSPTALADCILGGQLSQNQWNPRRQKCTDYSSLVSDNLENWVKYL